MRTALYVLLAMAMPAFAGQAVWKWVDEKGVTHFSDQPVPGATKMELSSGTASSSSPPPPSYSAPAASDDSTKRRGPAYSRFVIESPQQDESVINTGGKVTVRLAATPTVGGTDSITLYMDGAKVEGFPPGAMAHELENVPRGSHTLKAAITSQQGEVIQETPPITFHVRQESIANPPVGPAMRNRPRQPGRTAGNKMPTTQPSYSALNGGRATVDPRTNLPAGTKPQPGGPKN